MAEPDDAILDVLLVVLCGTGWADSSVIDTTKEPGATAKESERA
jgi:hypothetical protein